MVENLQGTVDRLRTGLKAMAVALVVSFAALLAGAGLFIQGQANDAAKRAEVCHVVSDALDKFVDLAVQARLDQTTDPADRLAIQIEAKTFKASLHASLSECS